MVVKPSAPTFAFAITVVLADTVLRYALLELDTVLELVVAVAVGTLALLR